MSAELRKLYSYVDEFFSLLDLDGNGLVDGAEADYCFHLCFNAVHPDMIEATKNEKDEIVAKQVEWLLTAANPESVYQHHTHTGSATGDALLEQTHTPAATATASTSSAASATAFSFNSSSTSSSTSVSSSSPAYASDSERFVTLQNFRKCYETLLTAAYEEEVLIVDIQRAVNALKAQENLKNQKQFFHKLNAFLQKLFEKDAHISIHHAAITALFQFSSGKGSLGPRQSKEVKRLLTPFLQKTTVDRNDLRHLWKSFLPLELPISAITKCVEEANNIVSSSTSASSTANSAKSSSSNSSSDAAAKTG